MLALAEHRRLGVGRQGLRRTPYGVATGLGLAHGLPVFVFRLGVFLCATGFLAQCRLVFFRAFQTVDALVYRRNLGLAGLEIAAGRRGVEHRRHEKLVAVAARQQSGERRKIAQGTVSRLNDEHSEHLAAVGVGAQGVVSGHVTLQLLRGQEAQGVRLVTERVGELCRP